MNHKFSNTFREKKDFIAPYILENQEIEVYEIKEKQIDN